MRKLTAACIVVFILLALGLSPALTHGANALSGGAFSNAVPCDGLGQTVVTDTVGDERTTTNQGVPIVNPGNLDITALDIAEPYAAGSHVISFTMQLAGSTPQFPALDTGYITTFTATAPLAPAAANAAKYYVRAYTNGAGTQIYYEYGSVAPDGTLVPSTGVAPVGTVVTSTIQIALTGLTNSVAGIALSAITGTTYQNTGGLQATTTAVDTTDRSGSYTAVGSEKCATGGTATSTATPSGTTGAAPSPTTTSTSGSPTGTPLWENINPGGGGQVQWLYPDPNLPGRIYSLADEEGVYRSDDYGATWRYLGKTLVTGDTRYLVAEPSRPGQQPGIPGKEPRVYLGTNYGLEYSDDAGVTWTPISSTAIPPGTPIDTVAVDPNNPDNVYAAPSWEEDDCFCFTPTAFTASGRRFMLVSRDRGQTWSQVAFTSTVGYRQVFTLSVDPTSNSATTPVTGSQVLYLGADAGVFRSADAGATWIRIAAPTPEAVQTSDTSPAVYDHSRGVAITPDGQYIFATYAISVDATQDPNTAHTYVTQTSVWVAPTSSLTPGASPAWHEVGTGLADSANHNQHGDYWRPEVDPRSSYPTYKVLLGTLRVGAYGLFEGTFTAGVGNLEGAWQKVFENRQPASQVPDHTYDIGWNDLLPSVVEYTYTPTSWPSRQVWMSSQQTVYVGDPNQPTTSWTPKSTTLGNTYTTPFFSAGLTNVQTKSYYSTGIASSVNFDMAGYKDFVVAGEADNGILESWDSGKTWTQRLSDQKNYEFSVQGGNQYWINEGDSFLTVPVSPAIMLAGFAPGYGGGPTNNGFLIGMKMGDPPSPSDTWTPLAGGKWGDMTPPPGTDPTGDNMGGLPRVRIQSMSYDPRDPRRVVVATHHGVYMTDDVTALFTTTAPITAQFHDIGGDIGSLPGYSGTVNLDNWSFKGVAFDPNTPNVLYAMAAPWDNSEYGRQTGTGRVFKATFDGAAWHWSVIYPEGGAGNSRSELAVWSNNGITYVALSFARGDNTRTAIYLSSDGGATFAQVLTAAQAVGLKSGPDVVWYDPSRNVFALGGLTGYRDQLFVTVADHPYNRGYAALKGTIGPDGTVRWEDWTGDSSAGDGRFFPFPDAYRARVITTDAGTHVYFATEGMGMWRRAFELTPATAPSTATALATATQTTTVLATNTTMPTGATATHIPTPVLPTNTPPSSPTATSTPVQPTPTATPAADLAVSSGDITFNPTTPVQNDQVTVSAAIHNVGNAQAGQSVTRFYDGDPTAGGVQIGGDVTTTAIPARGGATISVTWNTHKQAGVHTIYVVCDATHTVEAIPDANNTANATVAVKANKVKNGDFEDDSSKPGQPDNWAASAALSVSVSAPAGTAPWDSTTSAPDGMYSAELAGNGGNAATQGNPSWSSDPITVTPGAVYNLSAWIKTSMVSSAPSVGVEYLNALGAVVSRINALTPNLIGTTPFGQFTTTITVPIDPAITQLRVRLVGFSTVDTQTSGNVWFDNVQLWQ